MLVNCVAYQDGKKLADIPKEAIGDYVRRPDCFVWVALKDPEPVELDPLEVPLPLCWLKVPRSCMIAWIIGRFCSLMPIWFSICPRAPVC